MVRIFVKIFAKQSNTKNKENNCRLCLRNLQLVISYPFRRWKIVFVVAERYILWDVARKHILIGCEKAEKIMSAKRKRCKKEVQGVSKVFRHWKWAVCGELVQFKTFLRKYQMKKSIIYTLSENYNKIKQTWHQLQSQTGSEVNL